MADFDSSLPVRSEADGTDERLQTKIVDATNPDTQQAEVDTDSNLHVEVHGNRADDGADVVLDLSEEGKPNGRGDYEVDDNSEPASSGIIAGIRSANNNRTDQTEHITSIEDAGGTVRALDISLHDEAGEAYSGSNPLPVTFEQSEGAEVHDFNEGVDIASSATSNHDYSVGNGDTFLLRRIHASASSKMKVELQIGDGAASEIFSTVAVNFNSTAHPEASIELPVPIVVIGTVNTTTVRVIRTNLDNQAQSLYSTVMGVTN